MSDPSTFHEVVFPIAVSFGATGGPSRKTEVVTLGSGAERRNARWVDSRRQFDAGSGIRSLADLATVVAFFEQRRGRLYGFRYRDPLDDRSGGYGSVPAAGDQTLGTGNGLTATFRLVKAYGAGSTAWSRLITKPVASSVRVAVGGSERLPGVDFTVDTTTGSITFAPGRIPPAWATVTAGFQFHVPVRFDTDEIRVDLRQFNAGQIPSIPLVEIRI